jgi:Transglycosylase SLT domain/SPOR domain
MRRHIILALFLAHMATAAHAETSGAPVAPETTQSISSPGTNAASPAAPTPSVLPPVNTVDVVCQRIESAAVVNGLPLEFLTRLIWQESRFDAHAISRAGAQGIAQFMPKTAEWVGLGDPFDASEAIGKSAALLRNLRAQLGNLGLAAAAYNAGPRRVSDWLEPRRDLPRETLAYVRIVTGHAADEWTTTKALPAPLNLALPEAVPCQEIVKLFAEHRGTIAALPKLQAPLKTATAAPASPASPPSPPPSPPWGVRLIGGPSQTVALASFYQMQKTYRTVLGARQPMVLRTSVGAGGSWYRVRIGADNRGDAERLCSNLRAVGGSCLVQPN